MVSYITHCHMSPNGACMSSVISEALQRPIDLSDVHILQPHINLSFASSDCVVSARLNVRVLSARM